MGINASALVSVSLTTGVILPSAIDKPIDPSSRYPIIVAHGLGARNPQTKNHENDEWVKLLKKCAANPLNIISIAYTARGHGESTGWQESAESDLEQFTWSRLSGDMVAIAAYYNFDSFIASGSSMGSATALYTAILHPDKVRALVMIRPPTAWEERRKRKANLTSCANKLLNKNGPADLYHFVLRGAASSDLPHPGDMAAYSRVRCPTLILALEGDDAHPVSTAKELHRLIGGSELHIAENEDAARAGWPGKISTFLSKVL